MEWFKTKTLWGLLSRLCWLGQMQWSSHTEGRQAACRLLAQWHQPRVQITVVWFSFNNYLCVAYEVQISLYWFLHFVSVLFWSVDSFSLSSPLCCRIYLSVCLDLFLHLCEKATLEVHGCLWALGVVAVIPAYIFLAAPWWTDSPARFKWACFFCFIIYFWSHLSFSVCFAASY